MNIEVLLVANGASTENGLLTVHGGGWEYFRPAFFPFTVRAAICGIATLDKGELGTTPIVTFRASAKDGQELGWVASSTVDGVRTPSAEGVPIRVPFMVLMSAVVSAPTVVTVTMSEGGTEIAATSFAVSDSTPDSPPLA